MPRKATTQRSLHSRIEEARELLQRARSTLMAVHHEAIEIAQNKRRRTVSRSSAGRRSRMTGSICSTLESLRELMWEMPGVDYTETD